jgi:hypothetical protein
VLSQEIAKGFVGKLLEILHLIAGEKVERLPGFVVELDTLAFHRNALGNFSRIAVAISDMAIDPRQPTLLEKKKNI